MIYSQRVFYKFHFSWWEDPESNRQKNIFIKINHLKINIGHKQLPLIISRLIPKLLSFQIIVKKLGEPPKKNHYIKAYTTLTSRYASCVIFLPCFPMSHCVSFISFTIYYSSVWVNWLIQLCVYTMSFFLIRTIRPTALPPLLHFTIKFNFIQNRIIQFSHELFSIQFYFNHGIYTLSWYIWLWSHINVLYLLWK